MTRIPVDLTAPIACTATSDEIPGRIDQLDVLRDRLVAFDRTGTGLVLHFDASPATAAHLQQLVRDEKGCCRFWGFEIEARSGDLVLRWDGPPAVQTFLDELDAYFRSDQPLHSFPGLL